MFVSATKRGIVSIVATCLALWSCSSGSSDDSSETVEPVYLVASEPALDATDIYPAPRSQRFTITLSFSAPLSTETESLPFTAAGQEPKPIAVGFDEDATTATLELVGSSITGAQLLLDNTTYELDLSELRGAEGQRLDLSEGLEDGVLRFTTGVFDPLLNHACGHTEFGPFGSAYAAGGEADVIPKTDIGHTNYAILLRPSEEGFYGWTELSALAGRRYVLLFDRNVPLEVEDEPVELVATPDVCEGIRYRAELTRSEDTSLLLHFGPTDSEEFNMIVEVLTEGGS